MEESTNPAYPHPPPVPERPEHPAHQNLFVIDHAKNLHRDMLASILALRGESFEIPSNYEAAELVLDSAEALLAEMVKRGRL
jgi:hypothetical protein